MRCAAQKKRVPIALTSVLPVFFPEADSQLLHSCDSNINKQTRKGGSEAGARCPANEGAGVEDLD